MTWPPLVTLRGILMVVGDVRTRLGRVESVLRASSVWGGDALGEYAPYRRFATAIGSVSPVFTRVFYSPPTAAKKSQM